MIGCVCCWYLCKVIRHGYLNWVLWCTNTMLLYIVFIVWLELKVTKLHLLFVWELSKFWVKSVVGCFVIGFTCVCYWCFCEMVMVNDEVVLFKLGFMVFKSNSVFLELFGKGCGENDVEADAGVFWDCFWRYRTRWLDQKGYAWGCLIFILCRLPLTFHLFCPNLCLIILFSPIL